MNIKGFGVYQIKNKINGKIYIGSTIASFQKRWNAHKYALRGKSQKPHENQYLQNAWNKDGEENFEFSILEEMKEKNEELVFQREQYYMDLLKSYDRTIGYNMCEDAGSPHQHSCVGENHFNAILTQVQVNEIRERAKNGELHTNLSKEYKVKPVTITAIVRGRIWTEENYIPPPKVSIVKLNMETAKEIRKEYSKGDVTQQRLADKYGVSREQIRDIILNRFWVDADYSPPNKEFKQMRENKNRKAKKLTDLQVNQIREEYKNSTCKQLGQKYELSLSAVNLIVQNKVYFDPNYTPPTKEFTLNRMKHLQSSQPNA